MGCATTTVKISSIVFNILLALVGIGSIIWVALNPDAVSKELAIGAYIICSLIILFALFGCFAAIKESVCLTATCAVFLLILAVLQIIGTCINLSERETRSGIAAADYAWDQNSMEELQIKHECCGKASPQDYIQLERPIPRSCFANQDERNFKGLFTIGCSEKMQKYFEKETMSFAVNSWLLIAFEILGFLLAVFLVVNFRNKQRRMQF